tara:strand:- start:3142 stop:5691 length:2550 start_codon:yes stop_codon:yes gene_type:complete
MAAVTQIIPNFLGGVSRQTDDKKREGSFVDVVNGYSDPTNGLVKRGATRFLWNFDTEDNEILPAEDLEKACWFFVEGIETITAENQSSYPAKGIGDTFLVPAVGAFCKAKVYLWNALTGQSIPVTNNGADYLTREDGTFYDRNDFHTRTILDTVILTNKQVVTKVQEFSGELPNPKTQGTVRINQVVGNTTYNVKINGATYSYTTENETSITEIISGLQEAFAGNGVGITSTVYKTSLEISAPTFDLEVTDSLNNALMNSYQDDCLNISLLAKPSKPGRNVTILNSSAAEDDYYLTFDEVKGDWEESLKPGLSPGLDASTMPHRLFYRLDEEANAFKWFFEPCPWEDRLVGDDDSNPQPSFIGKPVKASFFYNNRLGLLSFENVNLSRDKKVFNFYGESQLALLDTDNVDLSATSTRPTDLFDVIVQQQGIVLFGKRQQFFLSAPDNGVITPNNTVIKPVCNYELNPEISPQDMGTTVAMVSRSPDYSRLMLLQGDGLEVDAVVVDISKVVSGWLPDVNMMEVSSQNSFAALTKIDSSDIYLYRFYNDGQEDKMQAWQRWTLPGAIKKMNIVDDLIYFVVETNGIHTASVLSLNELDTSSYRISDKTLNASAPAIDFLSKPLEVIYDQETDISRLYIKFPYIEDAIPAAILTLPTNGVQTAGISSYIDLLPPVLAITPPDEVLASDPGYYQVPTVGSDENGVYFEVGGNWLEYDNAGNPVNGIALGYAFEFEAHFPTFYYRLPNKNGEADYTAYLNVSRLKFSVGKTGAIRFKLKARGREEWDTVIPVINTDYYAADTEVVVGEQMFTLPINQRNTNFQVKVTSNLPYPVSLVSMMWEGQYSPRFYRRL